MTSSPAILPTWLAGLGLLLAALFLTTGIQSTAAFLRALGVLGAVGILLGARPPAQAS